MVRIILRSLYINIELSDVHERPFSPSLQQITNFSQRRDKSCHNPQSSSSNPRPRGPSDTDSTTNRDTVYEPQSKGTIISQDKGVGKFFSLFPERIHLMQSVFGNNVSESQELALHIAVSKIPCINEPDIEFQYSISFHVLMSDFR